MSTSRILSFILSLIFLSSFALKAQERHYSACYEWSYQENTEFEERMDDLLRAGYQIDVSASAVKLTVADFRRFVAAFGHRKDEVSLTTGSQTVTLSRDDIHQQLQDQLWSDRLTTKKKIRRFKRHVKRIMRGKSQLPIGASPVSFRFATHWVQNADTAHFGFIHNGEQYARLTFMPLAYTNAGKMKGFTLASCLAFDRYTYFLNHTSPATKIPRVLPPYQPKTKNTFKHKFTLHYNRNDIYCYETDFKAVTDYLATTSFDFNKAHIAGFASVEGDSVINHHLHQKRAAVLVQALERQIGDSIPYQVSSTENWTEFYENNKKLGLDSLRRDEWRELLKNDSVLTAMEPHLANQRKAVVTLFSYQRLDKVALMEEVLKDANKYIAVFNTLTSRRNLNTIKLLRRILGIRAYVQRQVKYGMFPVKYLTLLDEKVFNGEYTIITFYIDMQSIGRPYMPASYLAEKADAAFKAAKYIFEDNPKSKRAQKDLMNLQKVMFENVLKKQLPVSTFLNNRVPDELLFSVLKLNELSFIEKLLHKKLITPADLERGDTETMITQYSRYYYLLKKIVLGLINDDVKGNVIRTDWMLEFDRWEFLYYNINTWRPLRDRFFDDEVGVNIMHIILRQLINGQRIICPDQVDQLALTFYNKILQLAGARQYDPKLVKEAFNYITQYYSRNRSRMDDRQRVEVSNQIKSVNDYFFYNNAKAYADEMVR